LCWEELKNSFSDADHLVMTEVYAASEEPIVGVSAETLLNETAHASKEFCASLADVPALIAKRAESGDVVLCLGAGPIGVTPPEVLAALREGVSDIPKEAGIGAQELRVVAGGR
jgi:UDP-N-acetylmuramate--alanine ligase